MAPAILAEIQLHHPMKKVPLESLECLHDEATTGPNDEKTYPLRGTFSELKDSPLIFLHTSGSSNSPPANC